MWCLLCPGQLQLSGGAQRYFVLGVGAWDPPLPRAEGSCKHTSQFLAGHYQWSMPGSSLGVALPWGEISHSHSSPLGTTIWDVQWGSFFFF